MKDLHNSGLRGRLACFIEGFLRNRNFCVRLGSYLSDLHEQEMGVPQGSILSVTLFGLKINSIVKAISPGVDCSLYVDDFLICYRSKHIHIRSLQKWMQTVLDEENLKPFVSVQSLLDHHYSDDLTPSVLWTVGWWWEGHPACKKLDVGLLIVMIWLGLCTSYNHHLHHP